MGTRSMPGESPWLSVAETARELGISEMTLYRAIQAGDFPAVRVRNRLIVPRRALDDLAAAAVAAHTTVDSTTPAASTGQELDR